MNPKTILQPTVTLADPHICTDARNRLNIFSAIFDCLVRRNPNPAADPQFLPALATNWHVADDARQWTFTLRDDVHFHNGATLTAADVVASLVRACDPSVGGELGTEGVWASYLGDAAIRTAGNDTVSITTAQPLADLLDLLVAIPILPRALCERNVAAPLADLLIGTGPWRLVAHSQTEVLLEPFAKTSVRQPREGLSLCFRAEPERAARVDAFLSGSADLVTNLSAASANEIHAAGKGTLARSSNLCVAFLLNASKGPATNRAFRQALNHAINVDRMIEQGCPGAQRLNGPLSPHHFGCDPTLTAYPHDPARARDLLDRAGVGASLTVDLPLTLPDEAPLLGDLLAEDLATVGIDVTLRHFADRTAYAHRVKEKRIDDACCFDSSPLSTYRVLREKLNSDVAGPWWQGYANGEVNHLLDQAAATPNDAARQSIYRRAYCLLHEDAPWIFLYHPTNYWGVGAVDVAVNVEGVLSFSG